jgi:hypothetical protein
MLFVIEREKRIMKLEKLSNAFKLLCGLSLLVLAPTANASSDNGFSQTCGDSGNDLVDVAIKDCASKYGSKAQTKDSGMTSDLVAVIKMNEGGDLKTLLVYKRREDGYMAVYPASASANAADPNSTDRAVWVLKKLYGYYIEDLTSSLNSCQHPGSTQGAGRIAPVASTVAQ